MFTRSHGVIKREAAEVTHDESLRRPPNGGNCLNWVVGHIVVARANVLALLGEPPSWDWQGVRRYMPGSAPITDGGEALRFERLLADLDRSQEQLAAALGRLSPERLAAARDGKTLGAELASYHAHEAHHAGQIELLRQCGKAERGTPPLDTAISHATLVRAPRERVYDAFTTAKGLDGWFTTGASVDARPGGEIRWRWHEWGPDRVTAEDGGPVLEAQRPERFVFQWRPDHPGYATTVEVDFAPAAGGTVVRLREHGYQDTPSGWRALVDCPAGWGEALALLKFYVEHGARY